MHIKILNSTIASLVVLAAISFASYAHAEQMPPMPQRPLPPTGQNMPPREEAGQEINRQGMPAPLQDHMQVLQGSTSLQIQGQKMPGRMMPGPEMNDGSTSPRMRAGIPPMSSSTFRGINGDMHEGIPMRGIPGKVTDIESPYIIMVGRGMGMNTATTTFTVNLSASTTYSNASSTASFADITVGSMIAADGPFSTSTNTITARHIFVNIPKPPMGEMRKQNQIQSQSSDDRGDKGFFGGIGNFFGNMFGGKQPDTTSNDATGNDQNNNSADVSAGASAVGDTNFFDRVLSSLGHLF